MGRDLNGNELGIGFHQRSDKRYEYRRQIRGRKIDIVSPSLKNLKNRVDKYCRDNNIEFKTKNGYIKNKTPRIKEKMIIKNSAENTKNIKKEKDNSDLDDYSIFDLATILLNMIQYNNGKESNDASGVYFISDGKYVKIGCTNNIEKRIDALQTCNSNKLELLYFMKCYDANRIEKMMHEFFKDKRMNGEWFDILDLFKKKDNSEIKKICTNIAIEALKIAVIVFV